MSPAEAVDGFAADLAVLESEAAAADEYLNSRDGAYDRQARWQRRQLQGRIDKVRVRLEAIRAYLASAAEPEATT